MSEVRGDVSLVSEGECSLTSITSHVSFKRMLVVNPEDVGDSEGTSGLCDDVTIRAEQH